MGADIENPDDHGGCVVAAEPSRNTFWTLKERLVASFLTNPNGAGVGDVDGKAAKPPNSVGGAEVAATKPVKRGWHYYVLHLCSVLTYLVFVASIYPLAYGGKDRLHIVVGSIGVIGGITSTLFLCGAAEVE